MQFANAVRTLTLCSALALLASCGGGGNDFPETAPTTNTQPDPNTNPNTGTTTTPQTTPIPTPTNTGDTQAPRASMILPADDAAVTGNIQLLADASDNVAVAGVQFRVGDISLGDGLIPQPPYTTDFDTTYLPDGTHAFSARAYDTAGNIGNARAHSARVRNTCKTASPRVTQWQNTSFDEQSGTFSAEWQVTPVTADADALIGLARGAQDDWSGMSTAVRFNTNNTIDAMNGGTYGAAAAITYTPGQLYHIRMVVDVAARRYSAYVRPDGGAEQTIAENYAFRRSANRLDYWVVEAEQGALRGCSFSATPAETPPPPPPGNTAPTANAGPDQSVAEGSAVALTGAGTDTDGTIVSYAWAQIAGPAVTLANADTQQATFTAPQVTTATQLGFRLTVQDNAGATGSDTAIVTVNDTATANSEPTANAGPDQTAAEGTTVALTGSASDSDGTITAVQWSQLAPASPTVAISNANTLNASFVAPEVSANTVFTFQLQVTDNAGASTADSADVTITDTATTTTTTRADTLAPPLMAQAPPETAVQKI